jgi:hypothetical protein
LVAQVVPVENLVAANGLLQVSFSPAYFIRPFLLPALVTFFSFPAVFLVDALIFGSSVITLTLIHVSPIASPASNSGLWANLLAKWQMLRQSPEVQVTITTFVGVVTLVDTQLQGEPGCMACSWGLLA